MVSVEIRTSGTKRLNAKIKRLSIYTRRKFSPEVTQWGYQFARRIAPKDKNALLQAIKTKKGKTSGKISLYQPRDGRNRPYHLWMHGIKAPVTGGKGGYDISRGKYMPTSGKHGPKFMFVTAEMMRKEAIKIYKNKLNKL